MLGIKLKGDGDAFSSHRSKRPLARTDEHLDYQRKPMWEAQGKWWNARIVRLAQSGIL